MKMQKGSPKASVCLLSYNHGHVLAGVIEAVLNQTFTNYELIISDDCSTDNSWSIILDYAARYKQIRAVKTPKNIGMPGNLNHAANHASGEYLAILHHDDVLDVHLLESWIIAADQTGAAFVFNEYLIDGKESHRTEHRSFSEKIPGDSFLMKHLLGGWGCPVRGTALVRRDRFYAVGGVDERFGLIADVDLWMRLAARWPVGYVSKPLITVSHDVPKDYPDGYTVFSWERRILLYEIHAANIKAIVFPFHLLGCLFWLRFRARVSIDIMYFLLYSMLKGNRVVVRAADKSKNSYEFFFVGLFRNLLLVVY